MPEIGSRSAWTLRSFRVFLFARGVSWLGNAVTLVALPILMFQLTGSPALTAALTALEAVPYLAFGLLAGALADRWNRKRVMVGAGLVSGLVLLTIPAAEAVAHVTTTHVFVVAVVLATAFVFFDAASFGAIPEIVGTVRIASATGAMVSVSTIVGLIGPALGGVVSGGTSPSVALGLDGVAYVVAAVITSLLRWSPATPTSEPLSIRSLTSEIGEGLGYLWSVRVIRVLTLAGAGASISGGAMLGLMIVVAVRRLGLSDDDARLGLLYTATAIGALAVSFAAARIQARIGVGWITIASLAIAWAAQAAWTFANSLTAGVVILMIFQASSTLAILNGIIVRQTLTPDRLQGRVNTTARMIAWGGTPIGATAAGLLAEVLPVQTAVLICSVGTLAAISVVLSARLWSTPQLSEITPTTTSGA